MQKEQQQLQTQIDQISSQLSTLPQGNLVCARNGSHFKWYLSHDHQILYLPKTKRNFAEQLAIKKYLSCVLDELVQKKKAVDAFLHQYPASSLERENSPAVSTKLHSETLLAETSGYRELLLPYFTPSSQIQSQWLAAPYESNSKYPEQLIHKSPSGNILRSKSEAMIDMYLFTHHIPFRYECALTLGEATLFPDFTILHPANNRLYYWEHFGRMDDPSYAKNVFSKLQFYNSHGITPGIQLITTFENAENPLSFETIENATAQFFQ